MIEWKLGAEANESISRMIVELVNQHPILLQNIIEPSVNGFLSDMDVQRLIGIIVQESVREKIDYLNSELITPERVVEIVKEICHDIIGGDTIDNIVDNYLATDQFTEILNTKVSALFNESGFRNRFRDDVETAVASYIENESDIDRLVSDEVSNQVTSVIENTNIDDAISTAAADVIDIDNVGIRQLVKSSIDEKIDEDSPQIEGLIEQSIRESVSQFILNRLDNNVIMDNIYQSINSKVNENSEFIQKYIADNIPEFTKRAIEGHLIATKSAHLEMGNVQTQIPNGTPYDIIKIKCRQNVTPAFMWMLSTMVKDNTIEVIDAGG